MKNTYWIREDHPEGPIEIPAGIVKGERPGPVFTVIAGVHGAEYAPIAASHRLFRDLDPKDIRGEVRFVFIANMPAYRSRTMFVNPVDGKNLNRSFPGNPAGSHTEALAALIFDKVLRGSDFLVDIHSGDIIEDLIPFAIVKGSSSKAFDLASCFPVDYILDPSQGTGWSATGTTFAAASEAGVTSCMVESGGRGQLEPDCVRVLTSGILQALVSSGNLSTGNPSGAPRAGEKTLLSALLPVTAQSAGFFIPSVKLGERLAKGDALGTIYDSFGEEIERPVAPSDGILMLQSCNPSVEQGGTVGALGVIAPRCRQRT